jgi:3-oxoacyl-[acyl-carrier protein] reductase
MPPGQFAALERGAFVAGQPNAARLLLPRLRPNSCRNQPKSSSSAGWDVLVNNSGVYEFAPIEEINPDHFHRQFDVNVLGLLLTTQAAATHLDAGASIINVGSAITSLTPPNSAVYSATKGAVNAITGVLAKEFGPRKIRVNSINPGIVETEGTRTHGIMGSDFETHAVAQTPLGRVGQPGDVADVAVFLASNDSRWLNGEKLVTSGGMR